MARCKGHCRGLLPYITEYLEGVAGESVCERIRRHLIGCETCRMYIDTHGRVIELYKTWRNEKIPTGAAIRLRKRLLGVMAGETPGQCRRPQARIRKKRGRK